MPTIQELRLKQGLTQTELSVMARVSLQTVWRVENGKIVAKNTLLRLCDALGVGLDEVEGVNYARKIAAQG